MFSAQELRILETINIYFPEMPTLLLLKLEAVTFRMPRRLCFSRGGLNLDQLFAHISEINILLETLLNAEPQVLSSIRLHSGGLGWGQVMLMQVHLGIKGLMHDFG